ncbi:hypothetical protein ABZT43_12110 [Streptomyces sp. NPDC005349]|uniref:hypothetical protein n=1 Tax=Streptomyces sp. NPDC005349 TaxID=3157037 RepID=UPI0033BC12BE
MALGYPYVSITGQSEEGTIEVQVSVFDEYHLADETEILQAVSQTLAARPAITSVAAERYEVTMTKVPEA